MMQSGTSSFTRLAIIVAIIYLAIFFALSSGLINSIIEGSSARGAFIIPNRSVQTIGETIVSTMIMFMGMAGVFLLHQSGKARSGKSQQAMLIAGFATIAIALTIGFTLVNVKL